MRIHAPFSPEQVKSLNGWQQAGYVHPFTSAKGIDLFATEAGWVEAVGRPVVQTWAHDFMADWSWKRDAELETQRFDERFPEGVNTQTQRDKP